MKPPATYKQDETREEAVRFYLRTKNGGVSVGVVGALIITLLLAAAWFWLAVITVVLVVLYLAWYGIRKALR